MELDAIPRISLLDTIQEKLQREGKSQLETTNRLFYVARLTENVKSGEDLGASMEKFISRSKTENDITGMLLVLHNTCLHVIEGSTKSIDSHIMDLHSIPPDRRLLFDLRIVASVEDVGFRMFNFWGYKTLTGHRAETAPDLQPQAADELVGNMYINILKIGQKYSEITKQSDYQAALNTIQKDCKDLLPGHDDLLSATGSNYCITLEEYVETYFSIVDLVLENELVWPLPSGLTY